jgi:hypothetical protein
MKKEQSIISGQKTSEWKNISTGINDKFNGKGYEFKIHDWINGQVSNYPPCELLEEYALQNTLNRDKVKATLVKDHDTYSWDEWIEKVTDAICSLSLPTQKRKDPVDPLDSYYLKDGKWHCVECDKPMNLPTLSEEEIEKMAEKNSYFWMSDSKRIVAKQAYKEGFKAALKERTKPKEE